MLTALILDERYRGRPNLRCLKRILNAAHFVAKRLRTSFAIDLLGSICNLTELAEGFYVNL